MPLIRRIKSSSSSDSRRRSTAESKAYWYETATARPSPTSTDRGPSGKLATSERRSVYRIGADGAIRESFELTLQTGSRSRASRRSLPGSTRSPGAGDAARDRDSLAAGRSGTRRSGGDRGQAAATTWPCLLAFLGLSSVLAVIAWRRCRGFGLPRREQVAWGLFVLLLVFPAYFGFRLFRRWPIREPCPNCHARAARDRAACAGCGVAFPAPSSRESKSSPEATSDRCR